MRRLFIIILLITVLVSVGGCDRKKKSIQERAAARTNVIIDDANVLHAWSGELVVHAVLS